MTIACQACGKTLGTVEGAGATSATHDYLCDQRHLVYNAASELTATLPAGVKWDGVGTAKAEGG